MTADYTNPNAPAWWSDPAVVGNPLALGEFCATCNTRLEHKPNGGGLYACPFGPHEETAA